MVRFILGTGIPIIGTLLAFTMGGGHVGALLHMAELVMILSFVLGGMIMAYGAADISEMFRGGAGLGPEQTPQRLRKNVIVCEGASKFSLFGGFVACFLGVVITMGSISGDVSLVGERFSAAMSGLVIGAAITGILFQPLKFKFLNLLNTAEEAQRQNEKPQHEETVP